MGMKSIKLNIATSENYLHGLGLRVEFATEKQAIEITAYGAQDVRSKFVRDGINKMREFGWELAELVNLGSTWRAIFEPIKGGEE